MSVFSAEASALQPKALHALWSPPRSIFGHMRTCCEGAYLGLLDWWMYNTLSPRTIDFCLGMANVLLYIVAFVACLAKPAWDVAAHSKQPYGIEVPLS